MMGVGYYDSAPEPHKIPFMDFSPETPKRWEKGSHLHKLKPLPDPQGNRAERRAAAKKAKKSKKG